MKGLEHGQGRHDSRSACRQNHRAHQADPGEAYDSLTRELDTPFYERINAPCSFGGIKAIADSGWFAARPSGTENVYKIYAGTAGERAGRCHFGSQ
jgi:phosphoglucomutase